jgi:hypothetical protein
MAVLDVLQAIAPVAFPVVWAGGRAILFYRFRAKQRTSLQRFLRVGGDTLGTVVLGNPFGRDMWASCAALR